jgi:hypothetical protein
MHEAAKGTTFAQGLLERVEHEARMRRAAPTGNSEAERPKTPRAVHGLLLLHALEPRTPFAPRNENGASHARRG